MDVNYSREETLILLCARLQSTTEQQERLLQLIDDERLSWEQVLERASWYRVSGLLFSRLRDPQFKARVPAWVLQRLQKIYFTNGVKNHFLTSELRRVLAALQLADIPVLVLKGAYLMESVYRDPAIRPRSDNDLLVPEARAEEAQALVMALGYAPVGTPEEQEAQRAIHQHLPKLVEPQGIVKFEIHSHIVARDSSFRMDVAELWGSSRQVVVAGHQVRALSPERLLTHLAIHFFVDRAFRSAQGLSQICDISETTRHFAGEIDWSLLTAQVKDTALSGPVHCGLFLAQQLLDAPVPAAFLAGIAPSSFSERAARLFIRRRVLDVDPVMTSQWVPPDQTYSLGNLLRGVVGRLFPQRIELTTQYGEAAVNRSPGMSRLRKLGEGCALLSRYLVRPNKLRHELQVDRWMHSLAAPTSKPAAPIESGKKSHN